MVQPLYFMPEIFMINYCSQQCAKTERKWHIDSCSLVPVCVFGRRAKLPPPVRDTSEISAPLVVAILNPARSDLFFSSQTQEYLTPCTVHAMYQSAICPTARTPCTTPQTPCATPQTPCPTPQMPCIKLHVHTCQVYRFWR